MFAFNKTAIIFAVLINNNMTQVQLLMHRKERVYRIYLNVTKERNMLKQAQALHIMRCIDNRLAPLQIKNLHQFN